MNFYQFLIPRLNGRDIEKDFARYRKLVEKGIAGFIIFGGELRTVRHGIKELQKIAKAPLIIASDLEQGLGQQIKGGTLFPPAMAMASAIKSQQSKVRGQKLLEKTFEAVALEARYAGINTVFAPVLDINTNPKNPIISTRAFGEDPDTVSLFGCEMIKVLQENGVVACGKHFPGHGDTTTDSHIGLPLIKKSLKSLEKMELAPFREAIRKRVKMIMLGHLSVPALDSSGVPVSLSEKAVRYIRDKMKFKGMLITDAMNMGGIGKYSEEKASLMALRAGVDIILHPTDPDKIAYYLATNAVGLKSGSRIQAFRDRIDTSSFSLPHSRFKKNKDLAENLTKASISIKSTGRVKRLKKPALVILNDDKAIKGKPLIAGLLHRHDSLRYFRFRTGKDVTPDRVSRDSEIIVAIFSGIKAWKGGPSPWLLDSMKKIGNQAKIVVSFGSPYLLDIVKKDCVKINAFWDCEPAQKIVAAVVSQRFFYRQ